MPILAATGTDCSASVTNARSTTTSIRYAAASLPKCRARAAASAAVV